jgi:hypothetical protein
MAERSVPEPRTQTSVAERVRTCDAGDTGFGWIADDPPWLERTSHALAVGGEVWLVDPVDFPGLDERVYGLGRPRGVLQLLNRHERDGAAIARRLGVSLSVNPTALPETPFEVVPIPATPGWRETALWWPERRTLVVAEAVGTARHYLAPGRALGVHPLLRIVHPPRALLAFDAAHLLVGHGAGLHEDVPERLRHAVLHARREIPRLLLNLGRGRRTATHPPG